MRGRPVRWVVRAGDGATVGAILERMKVPADAVPRGDVFVGGRRVRSADEPVRPGDELRAAAAPRSARPAPTILLEARGVVAVDKPAGVPTIPDAERGDSLLADVARALGRPSERVHATSRLDRGVSGVVVFALDDDARERLARARADGRYHRRYVALATRPPSPPRGTWDAPIGRAKDPRKRAARGTDPAAARTNYMQIAYVQGACMLAVEPITGRTHQIRVHASDAGAPLVGDAGYGAPPRLVLPSGAVIALDRVALHCAWVRVDGDAVSAAAPIPSDLADLWASLGGGGAMWSVATSCDVAPPEP